MKKLKENGITVLDLFCGAGIGAVGIKQAGFNIIKAIDNSQYAVDTYNHNIGNHAVCLDLKKIDLKDLPYADVFVGGFPCQPFSLGGKGNGVNDKKIGDLGFYFKEAVRIKNPKAFVIENVAGISSKKHLWFLELLIKEFSEIGYNVNYYKTDCYELGVPQIRKRVFIVGIKKNIKGTYSFPEPIPLKERKNLRDALKDLPDPESSHSFKNHSIYYNDGFSSRYKSRNRQKQWNEPSFTICSSARQLPLYPEPQNYDIRKMDTYEIEPPRRFTVRECLRIQTVPDSFFFKDDINYLKQHIRCSGIPSLVAYKIFKNLSKILEK